MTGQKKQPMIALLPGKFLGARVSLPPSHRAFERLLKPIAVDETAGTVLCEWEMMPNREGETLQTEWFDKSLVSLVFDLQGK